MLLGAVESRTNLLPRGPAWNPADGYILHSTIFHALIIISKDYTKHCILFTKHIKWYFSKMRQAVNKSLYDSLETVWQPIRIVQCREKLSKSKCINICNCLFSWRTLKHQCQVLLTYARYRHVRVVNVDSMPANSVCCRGGVPYSRRLGHAWEHFREPSDGDIRQTSG